MLRFERLGDPGVAFRPGNKITIGKRAAEPEDPPTVLGSHQCFPTTNGFADVDVDWRTVYEADPANPRPEDAGALGGGVSILAHEVLHALGIFHTGQQHHHLPGFTAGGFPQMATCLEVGQLGSSYVTSDDDAAANSRWYQRISAGTDPGRWVAPERWVTPNPGFEVGGGGWKTVYPGTFSVVNAPAGAVQGEKYARIGPPNHGDVYLAQSHAIVTGVPWSSEAVAQANVRIDTDGGSTGDFTGPSIRGYTRRVNLLPSTNEQVASCDQWHIDNDQYPTYLPSPYQASKPHAGTWEFDEGTVFVGSEGVDSEDVTDGPFVHSRVAVPFQVGSLVSTDAPVVTYVAPHSDAFYTVFELRATTKVLLDNAGVLVDGFEPA